MNLRISRSTSPSSFRVGIVGTGWGRTHVGTVRACGSEVAVIVGRDPETARRVAQQEGVALGTTDLRALEDVDVVVIASPTPSHAALVHRFAHKRVICEKPLLLAAPHEAQAAAIRAAPLFVNYAFAFLPSAEALADLVRSGALGTVHRIELDVGVSLDASKPLQHWLLDVASHPLAWLSGVFGPFRRTAEEPGSAGAIVLDLQGEGPPLRLSLGPATHPGIEIAVTLHGSRRATLEGVYRTGGAWSFRTSAHGSTEHDDWYAANCHCIAAAMRAFAGEPPDDRLVDGAAALRIEAPLWAGVVGIP